MVFNHHSLQIFRPVRKTDLHKPNVYSVFFHLVLFCPYCVKAVSHNKSCLPITQSMKVNNWSLLCWEDWLQNHQCDGGFGPVSRQPQQEVVEASLLPKAGRGKGIWVMLASKMQAWLCHSQGDFSKGKTSFQSSGEVCCYFLTLNYKMSAPLAWSGQWARQLLVYYGNKPS